MCVCLCVWTPWVCVCVCVCVCCIIESAYMTRFHDSYRHVCGCSVQRNILNLSPGKLNTWQQSSLLLYIAVCVCGFSVHVLACVCIHVALSVCLPARPHSWVCLSICLPVCLPTPRHVRSFLRFHSVVSAVSARWLLAIYKTVYLSAECVREARITLSAQVTSGHRMTSLVDKKGSAQFP